LTGKTRADFNTALAEQLENRLAQVASRTLVNNLAAALKQTVADLRPDSAGDVTELKREFKVGMEEIRAAYKADMRRAIHEMRSQLTAVELEAAREYQALSQDALVLHGLNSVAPVSPRRNAR
jgi:hypothetical protein